MVKIGKKLNKIKLEMEKIEELEKELNEVYSVLAQIKLRLDKYSEHLQDDDYGGVIEPIDEQELIAEIYSKLESIVPKKFLIAERLELDDKEQKIINALNGFN